jgi:hypothetical protein
MRLVGFDMPFELQLRTIADVLAVAILQETAKRTRPESTVDASDVETEALESLAAFTQESTARLLAGANDEALVEEFRQEIDQL